MARKTEQRRAIQRVLQGAERPLTPREILQCAQAQLPGLGIATVYRNLKTFTAEGWLQVVELPHEPTRYELESRPHHHHFQCLDCGRVFDVPGCPGQIDSLAPEGFEVTDHQLLLYGACADCATGG